MRESTTRRSLYNRKYMRGRVICDRVSVRHRHRSLISGFGNASFSRMPTPTHRKHYIPLESNPEVFTHLINTLGVPSLEFQDVLSIDEPDLLALVTQPVLGLILVFPTSEAYEKQVAQDEAARQEYTGSGDGEDVLWFKQTINNACGLYGILHAVCNGKARNFISECIHCLITHVAMGPISISRVQNLFHLALSVQGTLIKLSRAGLAACKAPCRMHAFSPP
jgi:hypothetical protein